MRLRCQGCNKIGTRRTWARQGRRGWRLLCPSCKALKSKKLRSSIAFVKRRLNYFVKTGTLPKAKEAKRFRLILELMLRKTGVLKSKRARRRGCLTQVRSSPAKPPRRNPRKVKSKLRKKHWTPAKMACDARREIKRILRDKKRVNTREGRRFLRFWRSALSKTLGSAGEKRGVRRKRKRARRKHQKKAHRHRK